MMITAQITEKEDEAFLILPPEVLTILKSKSGDNIKFIETSEGVVISPCSEEFATAMRVGKEFMDKYPNAFETLAKS